MGLTKASIARPVFVLMMMLVAIFLGNTSRQSMRVELQPDVSFGVVNISTVYPGADPDTINTQISRKIEEAVSGVNGIREVTSTSTQGVSNVVVQLEIGVDGDAALNDVRSKVDGVVNALPKDALKPTVTKFDTSSTPVLTLAFNSTRLNSQQLRDLIDDKLVDRFAQINGVASATAIGGDQREIQVRVKPEALLSYGLGINDVTRAIQSANLDVPGGRILTTEREFTVRVKNQYENIDQLRKLVFTVSDPNRFGGKGKLVKLTDVADIVDTVKDRTSYYRLNGKDAITIAISKAKEGNAVEITQAADGVIAAIQKEYADLGITVQKTFEEATQIQESLADLTFSLAFGIFLVGVIVYIFLHNFRGTMIVALAIPTSIMATFIALKIAGFTINNLSMLALSLAVGVLVDDAIVVLENIFRHLKMGEDPREAAINGRSEIGLAAIAITLADVVVFLPIAFMGGIVGQFFKPLALGFVFATLFSLFVSFTLTPMLASRWYRRGEDVEHPTGAFARWFDRSFARLENRYRRALEWALNHRWFVFCMGWVILVSVFMFIGGSFMPAPLPPEIANKPGMPTLGPVGAMKMTQPVFMIALFLGMLVFVVNYFRNWNRLRATLKFVLITFLALVPLLNLILTRQATGQLGLSKDLMGMSILAAMPGTVVVLFVILVIWNFFDTRSKLRFVGSAILFGLVFPVASVTGYFYAQWKKEAVFKFAFLPDSDSGKAVANIEMPPGTSLTETEKVVRTIEAVMAKDPDVKYIGSTMGSQSGGNFGGGRSGSNFAQVSATLYDKAAFTDRLKFGGSKEHLRYRSSESVAADILYKLGRIPGAKVTVSAGSGFGFGSAIQLSFSSENRAVMLAAADKIRAGLAGGAIPGVINPDLSSKPGKPELRAIPDPVRIADYGISVSDLGSAMRTLYQGNNDSKLRENGREYDINVIMSPEARNNPNLVSSVPLRFVQGNPVLVADVATLSTSPGVDRIQRRNRAEEIQVGADLLPGFAAGTVQAQIDKWLKDNNMIPEGVRYRPLGQADAQARESAYLFGAIGTGILLVYMLLASLYDNLLYPLIIQLATPQAVTGAILALVLSDKSLNIVGMIGIIALMGLVGKNAILVVDYTNTLRSRGRDRHDALVEAGPTRLRPIMMTTLALILGTLPVALAIGRGSEFRETIGISIIGGITLSTFLTLLVIPCSYTIFDDLSTGLGNLFYGRKRRREAALSAEAAETPEPAER